MSSYLDLEIYQLAYKLSIEVHHLTLRLPKYEMYEQGSQVRRSSKRIKDTIAEGYGRKRYKLDFIKYLVFAHASCDETISHLNSISEIHFPLEPLTDLLNRYNQLGKKINSFIQYVDKSWK